MSTITKKPLTFMDVLRFTAGYWAQQPKKLFFIILMVILTALLESYLPTALADFLKTIQLNENKAIILKFLGIFLGVYIAQTLLNVLVYYIYNVFETNLFKTLVDDVFIHIYKLSEKFFVNTFTGSIVSKVNRARSKIEVFQDQILIRILPTFVILTGSLLFLMLQFPYLALILLGYLIILVIVSALLVFKVSGPAQEKYANAQDDFSANLADSISGIATTKSYAQESYEVSRYQDISKKLRNINLRAYLLGSTAAVIQRILLAGMLVILMGGGTWYFFQGKASVESMAYLAFAYSIMQSYIRDVGENIKNLLTSSYDLHGVLTLLQEEPEVTSEKHLNISRGEITFTNVEFTYPEKATTLFKNLSVKIKAGERIALVGHSGGGKSSFIRLLQNLYPIQHGSILIDGQNIYENSRFSLRKNIGLVPQEPILFHRSLKDNIAYARPAATDEEIFAAARKACIEDFILNLPEQYETLVGERGIKLSGGERQRIAIARAILADRPILILDEATSSLDSASERAIQNALHTLTHGRTSIMIAHRLSTILDADRILVFESGQIVEEGSHDQLIQKTNGIYASLYKLQSGGFIQE